MNFRSIYHLRYKYKLVFVTVSPGGTERVLRALCVRSVMLGYGEVKMVSDAPNTRQTVVFSWCIIMIGTGLNLFRSAVSRAYFNAASFVGACEALSS